MKEPSESTKVARSLCILKTEPENTNTLESFERTLQNIMSLHLMIDSALFVLVLGFFFLLGWTRKR